MALAIGGSAAGATTADSAAAGEATPAPVLDVSQFGVTETLLGYCADKDPLDAAKVHARLKRLTHGQSHEALADARHSSAYRAARESTLAFIGKVDPRNAKHLCAESGARGG